MKFADGFRIALLLTLRVLSKCMFKCELRHDLFYVDNTEQVRGVLLGHA